MSGIDARIELLNVKDGLIVHHPLLLLEGKFHCDWDLPDNVLAEIHVNDTATYWPVSHGGIFKALIQLPMYGRHELCLNIAETYEIVSVEYSPSLKSHRVYFYLQLTTTDRTDVEETNEKLKILQFNAMLIQTAMFQLLSAHGFAETFTLDVDENCQPVIRTLEFDPEATDSSSKVTQLLQEGGYTSDNFGKHVIIRGTPQALIHSRSVDHNDLLSSQVGVHDTGGIHTWAADAGSFLQRVLDTTADPKELTRRDTRDTTMGAQYIADLGSLLHLLGHLFGLHHSIDGIMGDGYRDLNHLFCIVKPRDDITGIPTFSNAFTDGKLFLNYNAVSDISETGGALWHRASALKLHLSPWIRIQPTHPSSHETEVSWGQSTVGPVGHRNGTLFGSDSKDVGAFLIESDPEAGIISIEILTNAALNDMLFCGLAASGTHDIFLLMDGEYIHEINVRVDISITALWFRTNFRISRVFGSKAGRFYKWRAPPNRAFYSLFGTITVDKRVGSIGACHTSILLSPSRVPSSSVAESTSPSPPSSIFDQIGNFFGKEQPAPKPSITSGAFATTGHGIDGDQDAFSTKNVSCIGAILMICTDSIVGFRVLSRKDYEAEFDRGYYGPANELAFVLAAHEVLIQVDARSSGWIHGLRFHTNVRISPWYGGFDGEEHTFICTPEACITGFYGSHGPQYLGTFGTYFGPLPSLPSPQRPMHLIPFPQNESFGMCGVWVHLEGTSLREVSTEVPSITSSTGLYFPLHVGEVLTQIEYCCEGDDIVGICFHTKSRSSKWFGSTAGTYDILVTPKHQAFESISIRSSRLEYKFRSEESCRVIETNQVPTWTVDSGKPNFRAYSPDGIAFVGLSMLHELTPQAEFVIELPQSRECPHEWYLSIDYLESHVSSSLHNYGLEIVDRCGGGFFSPILPCCL